MIRTLIIDDEQDAVDFIHSLIDEYCKQLQVVGTANSVKNGIEIIREMEPDLVFLDVEMPYGNGFDILQQFPDKKFKVIFITAFNHYAIQAIKFSAVDYILKPININEFVEAVEKVLKTPGNKAINISEYQALFENLKTNIPRKLAIPTSEGMEYLNTSEIIRVQADRSYSWFYLSTGKKYIVSRNLKEYQELLTDKRFFRTHNSHLINLDHVTKFVRQEGGYIQMSDGSHVPISRGKKDIFLQQMDKLS